MSRILIIGSIMANLDALLREQGHDVEYTLERRLGDLKTRDLHMPEPTWEEPKVNDLNRTYGKKYRRSLRR